jgi:hypothetical protein
LDFGDDVTARKVSLTGSHTHSVDCRENRISAARAAVGDRRREADTLMVGPLTVTWQFALCKPMPTCDVGLANACPVRVATGCDANRRHLERPFADRRSVRPAGRARGRSADRR